MNENISFKTDEHNQSHPEKFIRQRDKLQPRLLAFLDKHPEIKYKEMGTMLYLSDDEQSGFGINPEGTLISVFSLERGRGSKIVDEAVKKGAKNLGCLGDKLRTLYEGAGFKVVNTEPWNEDCAPENWDYEKFGRPNYYVMELDAEK